MNSSNIRFTAEQLKIIVLNSNPDFKIDEWNEKIFELLLFYFTGDMRFEEAGYSFNKGILLKGPVGCGKTTMMQIFHDNQIASYKMVSCMKVVDLFNRQDDKGNQQAHKIYSRYDRLRKDRPNDFGHTHYGMCFDDLGTEDMGNFYGNPVDVIGHIFTYRYDARLHNYTHCTMNLEAKELEQRYGTRIRGRFREMMNALFFDKNSPDRRK